MSASALQPPFPGHGTRDPPSELRVRPLPNRRRFVSHGRPGHVLGGADHLAEQTQLQLRSPPGFAESRSEPARQTLAIAADHGILNSWTPGTGGVEVPGE